MDTGRFPSEDMARHATRVWGLAKSIKIGVVSSLDLLASRDGLSDSIDLGRVMSQPMRARFQDDSNFIWFIPPPGGVFADIQDSQVVLATFSNGSEGDHIACQGTMSRCDNRDMLRTLWDSHADIHFPQGSDDPMAVLLQFEPHTAHFWTGGQDFVSFAVHYIAAKWSGKSQAVGEQGMVLPQ